MKTLNTHNSSNSAVVPFDKSLTSKVSFDIQEIRQEIKDRQSRHQEREREFDEIYKSVSENAEVSMFSRDFVETSESAPEQEEDPGIFWRCCKKMCKLL
jgi:hypothetical protein